MSGNALSGRDIQPSSALGSLHLLFLLPGIIAPRFSARLLPHYLSELCSENRLIDTAGAGEGGKIWENGIETCKISCMK